MFEGHLFIEFAFTLTSYLLPLTSHFQDRLGDRPMLTIGLTGGIASGKSTLSKMIQDEGIAVIDADVYARRALDQGERAYEKVIAYFGESILHSDGSVDRKKLGSIIFNDPSERDALNGIVHPAVREKMNDQKEALLKEERRAVVLDIPLLFESKLTKTVDRVLLVYVDEAVQLKRLMVRDGSTKEEALSRIRSQMPLAEKKRGANAVIDNNGTVAEAKEQLDRILLNWGLRDPSFG